MGVLKIGALYRQAQIDVKRKPAGPLGAFVVGLAFAFGWTPCIGPILGSILIYTSNAEDLSRGLLLLLAYSLGLAIPFVLSAVAIERFLAVFQRLRRRMVWVTRAAGVLLIAVGILLLTDYFTILASYLQGLTPEFLRSRL
jgi:cytochrome c-type biogenesis protein